MNTYVDHYLWWGHHKTFFELLLQNNDIMRSDLGQSEFSTWRIKNVFFSQSKKMIENDIFGGQFVSLYF